MAVYRFEFHAYLVPQQKSNLPGTFQYWCMSLWAIRRDLMYGSTHLSSLMLTLIMLSSLTFHLNLHTKLSLHCTYLFTWLLKYHYLLTWLLLWKLSPCPQGLPQSPSCGRHLVHFVCLFWNWIHWCFVLHDDPHLPNHKWIIIITDSSWTFAVG